MRSEHDKLIIVIVKGRGFHEKTMPRHKALKPPNYAGILINRRAQ